MGQVMFHVKHVQEEIKVMDQKKGAKRLLVLKTGAVFYVKPVRLVGNTNSFLLYNAKDEGNTL
jgi:hypothetical protein